ncbi:MAG: ATP-dependent Clp protease ATP-binding subunit [Chloroflexi bacterium]|nr:ATP-dependent Clp protease ATP-binding subunit [Chloroflexota bacterium]
MTSSEDRYTPRVRQALVFTVQEALRLRHATADPEHILLGMLREGTGLATATLNNLGVDLDALRASVESRLTPGSKAVRGEIEYSPQASQVFDMAADEAEGLKCHYIGQEHFLLAMLRQEEGTVAKILSEKFDVTYELARAQVIAIIFKPADGKGKVKRYNLALPENLFREVEQLAEREHMTVLEVLRRSVKLGLLIAEVQQTPGASFIIREGKTERQLVLL